MTRIFPERVCFITDSTYCILPAGDMVSRVLEAGIHCIQYREKGKPRRELYETALHLRKITRSHHATLIINDHADIALAVDADGVHLGQDDLPLDAARRIMGNRLIGISTHTLMQAHEAARGGADYIGFGPVFRTSTKDAGPPVGVDNLRLIKQNVPIPVVAIGGIGLANLDSVLETGADAVAVATAICRGDMEENTKNLIRRIRHSIPLLGKE